MARAKLEYDDSGSTFYYFLVSFYGVFLLIITYFLWPRKPEGRSALVFVSIDELKVFVLLCMAIR